MAETNFYTPTLQYLVDERFEFLLCGREKTGGSLDVFVGGTFVESFQLSGSLWSLCAVLIRRAKDAAGDMRKAFMTRDELQNALRQVTDLDLSDPKRVTRMISELRRLLNSAKSHYLTKTHGGPHLWGKRVIESHPLGYRLSVRADNLHLMALGDH